MNVLITGATSASGIESIKRYSQDFPDAHIFATGRVQKKLDALKNEYGVTPLLLDFNLGQDEFVQQLKKFDLPVIDIILHLCAAIPSTEKSPLDYYQVNLINARALIENLSLAPDIKILNFSSASVYDMASEHLHEDASLNFTHDYGASKYFFEKYIERKVEILKIQNPAHAPFVLSVRIPVLLTPGVQSNFIAKWRNDIQSGNPVKLFNPDSSFNSCVWIGDIFDFFNKLSPKNELTFVTCNVGVADKITILETFETLLGFMGKTSTTEVIKNDRIAQNYDCSKAKKLGFQGSTVKQAIEKFIRS